PERDGGGEKRIGQRAGDPEPEDELRKAEDRAPEGSARNFVGQAEIGRRLLRRRAVKAFALGQALTALQRRSVAQLSEVLDRRADVEHARFADKGALADANFADVQAIAVGAAASRDDRPGDDSVVAYAEQVRCDRNHR